MPDRRGAPVESSQRSRAMCDNYIRIDLFNSEGICREKLSERERTKMIVTLIAIYIKDSRDII